MCVEGQCGEGVVCTVVSEVGGEIASALEAVVIMDNPSSLEVCYVVEVLNVGNKGSKYKSVVDWLG